MAFWTLRQAAAATSSVLLFSAILLVKPLKINSFDFTRLTTTRTESDDTARMKASPVFGDIPTPTASPLPVKIGQAMKFQWPPTIPPSVMTKLRPFRETLSFCSKIVWYKPPVGLATLFIAYGWIFKRSFSITDTAERVTAGRKSRRGRSVDLDAVDREYDAHGGVESARAELCRCLLAEDDGDATGETAEGPTEIVLAALDEALGLSCPPRGSRESFVRRNCEPLSRLLGLVKMPPPFSSQEDGQIIEIAVNVIEVRTLDALLRVLRDGLLLSWKRLDKNEKYWSWRVRWYEGGTVTAPLKRWARRTILRATLEEDRKSLSNAESLRQKESEWLGHVQRILLSRPNEISSTLGLDDQEKRRVLLESDPTWVESARSWTKIARSLIHDTIVDSISREPSISTEFSHGSRNSTTTAQDMNTLASWSTNQSNNLLTWYTILSLVDSLPKVRGVGAYYLPDISNMFKQIDFKGVPSSFFTIAFAHIVHNSIKPHWPKILQTWKSSSNIARGIFDRRFYSPLRDILLDLLNRGPRLLDPYALKIEETSLDNMLRDLGVGDGTKAARPAALAAAARLYEQEISSGPIQKIIRGNVVRLLLIQIQQLKTDMLMAMGTIDSLVDANQMNVKLLAGIPSVLLVFLASKLFFVGLYSLRSKDIRAPMSAHNKMGDYLFEMEKLLVLASTDEGDVRGAGTFLQPGELGQFLGLVHKYLLLLDYSTPPIPTKISDSMHLTLQDFLPKGKILNTERQLALLRLLQSKHVEISKLI